jgi:alkylation response protein AidB-like acyl-CoA dehydrogenase
VSDTQSDDDLRMIRESARTFAQDEIAAVRARAFHDGDGRIDRGRWKTLAELGWIGLMVPESAGGAGLGLPALSAIAEELGAAILPEPLVCAAAFATGIVRRGDGAACADLLARICSGDTFAAIAWQESADAISPSGLAAVVETKGMRRALTGRKRFVAHAASADGFLVAARSEHGIEIHWLVADAPGIAMRLDRTADGGSIGEVTFGGTAVSDATCIASAVTGESVLRDALDEAVVATSAELLGVMRRTLSITLDYLRTRRQFGQPIGAFQALQHRAVDLYLQQELGAACLAATLGDWDVQASVETRAAKASRVKSRCSDAALAIGREAVQMHGAIGFTHECDVGLYLKRAVVLSARYGNAAAHRRRITATCISGDGDIG